MGRAADHAGFRSVMATCATGVTVVGEVADMGGSGGEPLLFYGGRYRMLHPSVTVDAG